MKLVPDDLRRRFYTRVFKWVVAFATWKFGATRAHLRDNSGSGGSTGKTGLNQSIVAQHNKSMNATMTNNSVNITPAKKTTRPETTGPVTVGVPNSSAGATMNTSSSKGKQYICCVVLEFIIYFSN